MRHQVNKSSPCVFSQLTKFDFSPCHILIKISAKLNHYGLLFVLWFFLASSIGVTKPPISQAQISLDFHCHMTKQMSQNSALSFLGDHLEDECRHRHQSLFLVSVWW